MPLEAIGLEIKNFVKKNNKHDHISSREAKTLRKSFIVNGAFCFQFLFLILQKAHEIEMLPLISFVYFYLFFLILSFFSLP